MGRDDVVELGELRVTVSRLDAGHPLRAVIGSLPAHMPAAELAALVPVMWRLAERPCRSTPGT